MKENKTERQEQLHEAANMFVNILLAVVVGICLGLSWAA